MLVSRREVLGGLAAASLSLAKPAPVATVAIAIDRANRVMQAIVVSLLSVGISHPS